MAWLENCTGELPALKRPERFRASRKFTQRNGIRILYGFLSSPLGALRKPFFCGVNPPAA
jgi:hypothetical protein